MASTPGVAAISRFVVLVMVSSAAPHCAARAQQGALDGLVFVGELIVVRTGARLTERITFHDGAFHSAASDLFGYADGPYSAWFVDGVAHFRAFTDSPALGYMVWSGTVASDTLTGTAVSKDPGEAETRYEVQADLLTAKAQDHGRSAHAHLWPLHQPPPK